MAAESQSRENLIPEGSLLKNPQEIIDRVDKIIKNFSEEGAIDREKDFKKWLEEQFGIVVDVVKKAGYSSDVNAHIREESLIMLDESIQLFSLTNSWNWGDSIGLRFALDDLPLPHGQTIVFDSLDGALQKVTVTPLSESETRNRNFLGTSRKVLGNEIEISFVDEIINIERRPYQLLKLVPHFPAD